MRNASPCALLLATTISACGASATQVTGPDGEKNWYAITCRRNQSNCIEKAGELCPSGYETESSNGRTQLVVTNTTIGEAYNGEMLVKCR